jgi:hypothetical protein
MGHYAEREKHMSDLHEYLHRELGFAASSDAWTNEKSEFVRFHAVGGDVWAFPVSHADSVCLRGNMLIITFGPANVGISGPKAEQFFELFCKRQLTSVKADGLDIVSVKVVR